MACPCWSKSSETCILSFCFSLMNSLNTAHHHNHHHTLIYTAWLFLPSKKGSITDLLHGYCHGKCTVCSKVNRRVKVCSLFHCINMCESPSLLTKYNLLHYCSTSTKFNHLNLHEVCCVQVLCRNLETIIINIAVKYEWNIPLQLFLRGVTWVLRLVQSSSHFIVRR